MTLLKKHIDGDAEFGTWLATLWADDVRPALEADASGSANVISGTVHGNVVQARDVQGSIHLA